LPSYRAKGATSDCNVSARRRRVPNTATRMSSLPEFARLVAESDHGTGLRDAPAETFPSPAAAAPHAFLKSKSGISACFPLVR
jgi:hypothetical protein